MQDMVADLGGGLVRGIRDHSLGTERLVEECIMMSSIFYGEIKEDKLQTWSENRNPYDILVENNRVERLGGWDFLFIAKELFTDEVQIDWGSFAYKCTRKQLQKLISEMKCVIPKIQELDPDKVYGIVFIEES